MGRIKVRLKKTGQMGTIEENDFNPQLFDRVTEQAPQPKKSFIERWNLLPIAGSILGGLATAGIGGGMAGAAGGEALEQFLFRKPRGEAISPMSIAGEAAMVPIGMGIAKGIGAVGRGALSKVAPALGKTLKVLPEEQLAGRVAEEATEIPFRKGIGSAGQRLQQWLTRPEVGKAVSPAMRPAEAARIGERGMRMLSAGTRSGKLQELATKYLGLRNQVKALLPTLKGTVPVASLQSRLATEVGEEAASAWADDVARFAVEGQLDATALDKLKSSVNAIWNRARKGAITGVQPPAKAAVAINVRDVLDDVISTKFPKLKSLTLQQSYLHSVEPGLETAVKRGVRIPTPLGGIPLGPAGGAIEAGADVLSRGMIKMGETTPTTLQNILGQSMVRAPFMGGQAPQTTQPTPEEVSTISPMQQAAPQLAQQLISPQDVQRAYLMLPYKDAQRIQAAYEAQSLGEEEGKEGMEDLQMASGIADQAEQMITSIATGRVTGGLGLAGAAVGIRPRITAYESFRKASIAPLARAISKEVGVLTDKDIGRAEGLLPKVTDTPEEVRLKLQTLRDIIARRSASGGGGTTSPYGELYQQLGL